MPALGTTRKERLDCPEHGAVETTSIRWSGGWTEPACPKCVEDRRRREANEQEERARILEERRYADGARRRLKEIGIPERFAGRGFAEFIANDPAEKIALRVCRAYAENAKAERKTGRCLILAGHPGTGKTHLAYAIAEHVVRTTTMSARLVAFSKATRDVKDTYSKTSKRTEQQAIDELAAPDFLVIDEIGVQFFTDTEKTIIFEIVNARYVACRPTIIVTNLAPDQLDDALGERTVDRLSDNGGMTVLFTGSSRRRMPRIADGR